MTSPRKYTMVSSEEDFLLLLRKWRSESTTLSVLGGIDKVAYLCVTGKIGHLDEQEKSVSIVGGSSYVLIDFGNCIFAYSDVEHATEGFKEFGEMLSMPYDDVVTLVNRSGLGVTIASLALPSDSPS